MLWVTSIPARFYVERLLTRCRTVISPLCNARTCTPRPVLLLACVPRNAAACQTMNEYRTGASQTLEAAQLIRREKRGLKLNSEVVHFPAQSCTHDDVFSDSTCSHTHHSLTQKLPRFPTPKRPIHMPKETLLYLAKEAYSSARMGSHERMCAYSPQYTHTYVSTTHNNARPNALACPHSHASHTHLTRMGLSGKSSRWKFQKYRYSTSKMRLLPPTTTRKPTWSLLLIMLYFFFIAANNHAKALPPPRASVDSLSPLTSAPLPFSLDFRASSFLP